MKTKILALLITASFVSCDPNTFNSVLDGVANGGGALSNEQIANGLKQALEIGIQEGSTKLSQVNGYLDSPYKILLPEEARKVTDRLQNIPGFAQLEAEIIEKINRGAEDAAKKAFPIFKDAITQMSFQDALGILMGEQDAATSYLNRVTYQSLYNEFSPVIVESLDKFQARKVWSDATTAYNRIPFVDQVNTDLGDYVTQQALTGLFSMVEKKEVQIREDVSARTTDLLRRVFAKQD